jgi:hypothetical protein
VSTRIEVHRHQRQPTSYCYGPIVQGKLLTHRAGGKHGNEEDLRWRFPSPAGCREELLPSGPSRSLGRWRWRIAMCSRKVIRYLGFSRRGVFVGEGASSGVGRGIVTHRGHGQGPGRATLLCGALVAPLHLLLGSLEASMNFWTFSFCFVQFRECFLCNFFETQKQQKTGNWHCGDLLIG